MLKPRYLMLAALLGSILAAAPAAAQEQPPAPPSLRGQQVLSRWLIDVQVGWAIPVGILGDIQNNGVLLGGGGGYRFSRMFAIRGDLDVSFLRSKRRDIGLTLWQYRLGPEINLMPGSRSVSIVIDVGFGGSTTSNRGNFDPVDPENPDEPVQDPFNNTYFTVTPRLKLLIEMVPNIQIFFTGGAYVMFTGSSTGNLLPGEEDPFNRAVTIPVGFGVRLSEL